MHQNATSTCGAIEINNGGKDRSSDQIVETDMTVQGIFRKISQQDHEKEPVTGRE